MKSSELSDSKLVAEYEKLEKKSSKLLDPIIDIGLGDRSISDLRSMKEQPEVVREYLKILDKMSELREEAKLRYGPDFMRISQLKYRSRR